MPELYDFKKIDCFSDKPQIIYNAYRTIRIIFDWKKHTFTFPIDFDYNMNCPNKFIDGTLNYSDDFKIYIALLLHRCYVQNKAKSTSVTSTLAYILDTYAVSEYNARSWYNNLVNKKGVYLVMVDENDQHYFHRRIVYTHNVSISRINKVSSIPHETWFPDCTAVKQPPLFNEYYQITKVAFLRYLLGINRQYNKFSVKLFTYAYKNHILYVSYSGVSDDIILNETGLSRSTFNNWKIREVRLSKDKEQRFLYLVNTYPQLQELVKHKPLIKYHKSKDTGVKYYTDEYINWCCVVASTLRKLKQPICILSRHEHLDSATLSSWLKAYDKKYKAIRNQSTPESTPESTPKLYTKQEVLQSFEKVMKIHVATLSALKVEVSNLKNELHNIKRRMRVLGIS